jgi:hypothetical protein
MKENFNNTVIAYVFPKLCAYYSVIACIDEVY